jgi:hypothetical protein
MYFGSITLSMILAPELKIGIIYIDSWKRLGRASRSSRNQWRLKCCEFQGSCHKEPTHPSLTSSKIRESRRLQGRFLVAHSQRVTSSWVFI